MVFYLVSLFLTLLFPLSASIDLEEMAQDFVLETKNIKIAEFPHAFNPSIIRWNGALLMSYRVIPDAKKPFNSEIGVIWLDENFDPISPPQLLDTRGPHNIPSRAEDPRLVKIGDSLFIIYSNNVEPVITKGGFRVFMAELTYDGSLFHLSHTECLSKFEGETQERREKNWVPFEYQRELLLAYNIYPHLILRPLPGTCTCETFSISSQKLPWDWGEIRGGTTALLDGDSYLAFFHSSKTMATVHSEGKAMPHYFMGAYLFSSEPPFEVTAISPEAIVGKKFYHGKNYDRYWGSLRVVFPGGFIFDDQYIWIAYGRQDHEIWITKLDKRKLLDSLIPVP